MAQVRSIKVCILTSVHPACDTRIFHKQAKTLVQAGYDVILIAQHEKVEMVEGVQILPLPSPRNRLHRMVGLTLRAFRVALKQRADVYHLHDPELLPVGLLLKLCTKAKIIYDTHEDVAENILMKEWLPAILRRPISLGFGLFEQLAARFVDRIVGATEAIAAHFSQSKTIAVRNYPLLSYFNEKGRDRDCARKDSYTLIYAGVLTKERGVSELIRSLELVDKKFAVRLKLLGRFDPPAFEEEVRSLEGWANVDYLGLVPYQEVIVHLRDADIGVVLFHDVPNHPESMPNKLFEYMAAGLPVIASNFPLWKEIVEGNECGLTVDPLNPQEIAQAIEYLLDHPELRQKMGENGRRAVLEKYNWENEAKKLLALYQELLENV